MTNKSTKILVHLHLFYHNQIDYFLNKLKNISDCNWDLYVTVCEDSELSTKKILKFKPDAKIIIVENRGYDVWPFIQVIRMVNLDDYDFVIKLHTKRYFNNKLVYSFDRANYRKGFAFRNCLCDAILGNKNIFKKNITSLKNDKIGMIASRHFLVPIAKCSEDKELELLDELKNILNIQIKYDKFIAGTMFLIKSDCIKVLKNSKLDKSYFSELQKSGANSTYAHSLERLFANLVIDKGYKIKTNIDFHYLIRLYTCLLEDNIFSIKNSNSKKHKIITFFGIKLKIRNKKYNKNNNENSFIENIFSLKNEHIRKVITIFGIKFKIKSKKLMKKNGFGILEYQEFIENVKKEQLNKSNEKRNLLFVTHDLSLSGAPLAVFNTANYYAKKGYNVTIIGLSYGRDTKEYRNLCKDSNISCYMSKFFRLNIPKEILNTFDFIFVNCALSYELVSILDNNKYMWRISEAGLIKDQLSDNQLFINAIKKTTNLYAVSELTKDVLLKYTNNVELLIYGIPDRNVDFKTIDSNKIKFCIIGNFCYRKAQVIVMYALASLPQEIKDKIEIVLIGDMGQYIKPFLKEEIENNITIKGVLLGEDKYKAIEECDICLCPSIDDPNPQVVMEAMMMKKPCIVTNKVGQSNYIDNYINGIVVDAYDTSAIAKSMRYFVENPNKIFQMAKESYNLYLRYFKYENYISKVDRVIDKELNI